MKKKIYRVNIGNNKKLKIILDKNILEITVNDKLYNFNIYIIKKN